MNPLPFRMTITPPCREQIRALMMRAQAVGLTTAFRNAMLGIERKLLTEPREWGDPYHNVAGLDAVNYGRSLGGLRLRVHYLAHNVQPVVILSAVLPIAGSPLDAPTS